MGRPNDGRLLKLFDEGPAPRPSHTVIIEDIEDASFIPADPTFERSFPPEAEGILSVGATWPAARCANRTCQTGGRAAMRAANRSIGR